ncbi:MAG: hypothetical protein M3179_09360, partial [Actinomycetota bacterium]|nr:hypothetical protein [Actinomycetota bacterium]
MPASDDEADEARKRAHWVSLRTLQRVPNVVGETPRGEPIVEVGSARLVLPHGSNNFYHLSPCPECGTEAATDVVLTTAHLSRGRPQYCANCAPLSRPVVSPADDPTPPAHKLQPLASPEPLPESA